MSLTHEELEEMIPAAALDILTPTELEHVLAHVRAHPECAKLLQEYREAAAALALELPGRHLDPARSRALRARLLARAGGQGESRARALRFGQWSGWAVAAGFTGILLVHHSVHRTLDYGWLMAGVLTFALVGLGLYARRQQRRAAELQAKLDKGQSNL